MGEDLNQKIDKKQQSLGQEIMQQAAQLPEDAAERALLRERAQLFTQFSEAIESVQDAINDVENEVVRNGYLQALLQAIQLINPETLAVAMVNFKRAKDAIET
ncbi:hypothetical protein HN680_07580, partial [Candidatus Peregrinibacteria bacterium]|nr:hypothetical protein [Candidatus Peregrinibacteria bacterium]